MTMSRRVRIDRRRLLASSAMLGGAAMLPSGQSLLAGVAVRHQGTSPAAAGLSVASGPGGRSGRVNALRGTEASSAYELEIKWSFALENYSDVATALTLDADVLYFANDDDVVFAVDATTGAELWRLTTQGESTSLNVVDGVAYFGSREDHLYAVDAQEGTVIWRFENPGICTYPHVVDGIVYFGNGDGNLYALDAATGSERWRFATPDGMVGPVVADGIVYIGVDDSNSTICAVGADDGTERWRFAPDYDDYGWAYPHVADGVVYIRPNDTLYAVDATTGHELWKLGVATVFSDNWFGAIQDFDVRDGVLYAHGDTHETRVGAFDARSGAELWRSVVPDNNGSLVAVDDEAVYVTDAEHLLAFDAASGSPLWSTWIIDFNLCCSPQILEDEDQLCVVYRDSVFALDKATQQEIWRYTADESIDVQRVILGSGGVYCALHNRNTSYHGAPGHQVVALGPATPSLKAGGAARVTTSTALRGGPSPTAVERAVLEPDTMVTITGEAETGGDIVWWPVTVDETGDQGWVDASALEPAAGGPAA